jgi:hypothetical protein
MKSEEAGKLLQNVWKFWRSRNLKEEDMLYRLFWYLNSGGRRNWEIIDRPDKISNEPRPDFLCFEKVTKHYMTVEVKTVLPNEIMLKTEYEAAKSLLFCLEVMKRVKKKVKYPHGIFSISLSKVPKPESQEFKNKVNVIAQNLISYFNKEKPLPQDLEKMMGSCRFLLLRKRDYDINDELGSYEVLVGMIKKALEGAEKKFQHYKKGIGVLLLEVRPLVSLEEYEILNSENPENYPHIDRFYAMDAFNKRIIRCW